MITRHNEGDIMYKIVNTSEATTKASELSILGPDAVAAALLFEQKPENSICVEGVINCVCNKSLKFELVMMPGIFGGGPTEICPDCGTRISIMEGISNNYAVVTASVEAVDRKYINSNISLSLTGCSMR